MEDHYFDEGEVDCSRYELEVSYVFLYMLFVIVFKKSEHIVHCTCSMVALE